MIGLNQRITVEVAPVTSLRVEKRAAVAAGETARVRLSHRPLTHEEAVFGACYAALKPRRVIRREQVGRSHDHRLGYGDVVARRAAELAGQSGLARPIIHAGIMQRITVEAA